MTVQSSDPTRVLVSPDAATPGTASFTTNVANGATFVPYHVQGVENVTGSAKVTVSAPGFASAGQTVQVAASGVEIHNLDANADESFARRHGHVCAGRAALRGQQPSCAPCRTCAPAVQRFVVTLANSNQNVGRLRSDEPARPGQSVTKPIKPGFYYPQATRHGTAYGLAFDPAGERDDVGHRHGSGRCAHHDHDRGPDSHGHHTVDCSIAHVRNSRSGSAGGGVGVPRGLTAWRRHAHRYQQRALGDGRRSPAHDRRSGFDWGSGRKRYDPRAPVHPGPRECRRGGDVDLVGARVHEREHHRGGLAAGNRDHGLPASVGAGAANVTGWYVQVGLPNDLVRS